MLTNLQPCTRSRHSNGHLRLCKLKQALRLSLGTHDSREKRRVPILQLPLSIILPLTTRIPLPTRSALRRTKPLHPPHYRRRPNPLQTHLQRRRQTSRPAMPPAPAIPPPRKRGPRSRNSHLRRHDRYYHAQPPATTRREHLQVSHPPLPLSPCPPNHPKRTL